jgi:DNA-binding Xre family transcriptional regulator
MTAYGLAKASNGVISLPTAYRLSKGEFRTISIDVLGSLCQILGVEPGDLFEAPTRPRKRRGASAPKPATGPRSTMPGQEFMGAWWTPDVPEDRLTGTLAIGPDQRSELTLVGSFRPLKELQKFHEHPVLLGAAGGKKITLRRCAEITYTTGTPGVTTTKYLADVVLIGALIPDLDEPAFEQITASYEYLPSWFRRSGYKRTYHHDEDGQLTGFTLNYTYPPTQVAKVVGAELRFTGGFQFGGPKWGELKARQTVRLNVRPDTPAVLEHVRSRYLHPIQNLIAFGVGHPVTLLELSGTLADAHGSPRHEREVEILFQHGRRGVQGSKSLAPWDMLFTLPDLGDDLGAYFQRWLDNSERLAPVFNLYFGTVFNPGMYGEHRFLSLAQAAESYHRLTQGQQSIIPSKTFGKLHERLSEVIDEAGVADNAATMFKSKLAFLNETVLKTRLRDLVSLDSDLMVTVVQDSERFIQAVAATRNYLTHFISKSRAQAVVGFELYRVTEQLRFLIECRLLAELGFSAEKKRELLQRSQRHLNERRILFGSS